MNGTIWDFVIDGLFVVYTASLLGVIAGTTNSFGALLFSIFGGTVEDELTSYSYTWVNDTKQVLSESATMIKDLADVEGTVFPIGLYIITFVLFIGSVMGVVTVAMKSLASARAGTARAVAVPVRPVSA